MNTRVILVVAAVVALIANLFAVDHAVSIGIDGSSALHAPNVHKILITVPFMAVLAKALLSWTSP